MGLTWTPFFISYVVSSIGFRHPILNVMDFLIWGNGTFLFIPVTRRVKGYTTLRKKNA